GHTLPWYAQALNPGTYEIRANSSLLTSDMWDGSAVDVNVDDLPVGNNLIELTVYHISGHSTSGSAYVNVSDTTAPDWVVGPSDQAIDEGVGLNVQFSATDLSGIGGWSINDTMNFHIDSSGLLTNNTVLPIGDYGLRVSVWDVYGNLRDHEIRIRILFVPPPTTTPTTTTTTPTTTTTTGPTETTTPPPPLDSTTLFIIAAGSGAAIVVIVILVTLRKRGG
ncbi:MAG: hypothetical protein JSW61_03400, partial [Candidatus Thorarchaeota archaeon]